MGGKTGSLVLLHDPSVLATRTGEVARLLARALKQPIPDVAQRVRYGGGILARDVEPEPAARVIADLGAAGIEAFVVPVADAGLILPRTRRIASLTFTDKGLEGLVRSSRKEPVFDELPWSRIRAFHVNAFARELSPEEVEEGRPTRALPDVEQVPEEVLRMASEVALWEDRERTRRIELCLDIIVDEPLGVVRLSADEADYSTLPNRADNALSNFVILLRMLFERAPKKVVVPPVSRRFAEVFDWKAILVEKPEQRENFNLWFAHAVRHGRPFGVEAAALAALEEASEVHDDELEDGDEALVVGEHEDSSDAEDLEDDGDEDEDEEDDGGSSDDTTESADDLDDASPKSATPTLTGADAEVVQALGHFDKTRKFRKSDLAELLADAQKIDDKAVEGDDAALANVDAELAFFEDNKGETGRFDVSELVKDSQALDDADVADDKKDPGA